MPDLNQLLHRAAELAPEWCDDSVQRGVLIGDTGYRVGIGGVFTEQDRALILFAVLKECERRGLTFSIRTILDQRLQIAYVVSINGRDVGGDDLTTAALSAFVSYLEATTPVTNEGVTNAGE